MYVEFELIKEDFKPGWVMYRVVCALYLRPEIKQ